MLQNTSIIINAVLLNFLFIKKAQLFSTLIIIRNDSSAENHQKGYLKDRATLKTGVMMLKIHHHRNNLHFKIL